MLVPTKTPGRALLRSIGPMVVWAVAIVLLFEAVPTSAWRLKRYGPALALGAIGLWRYGWYLLNVFRSTWFVRVTFPRLRRRAFAPAVQERYPRRLFVVVASYKESPLVESLCFGALVDACATIPSEVTVVISVGTPEEAAEIREVMEARAGAVRVNVMVNYQSHGKRLALGYALRAVAREYNDPRCWHADSMNDLVVLMDGDSVVAVDALEKCLPYFRTMPQIGALTTNEIPVVFKGCGAAVKLWYGMKISRRHQLMSSHALAGKLLTLTGRFSVFRASLATSEEFIRFLDRDHLTHWAYGRIRFLMGDDKSTMFCLLKNGWDMLYVPDAFVFCLEDRKGGFFKIANVMMLRWYGNMLRNNGRALRLGLERMPVFTWLAFLDQRISMWTSLIGPVSALLLSVTVSGWYLALYVLWVLASRLVQLGVLTASGHTLKWLDLPLLVFDQWYGSLVKIYCSVNLHRQVWQKSRAQAQVVNSLEGSFGGVRRLLPFVSLSLYFALFLVAVAIASRALRIPAVF
jgi:glycosyltransferase Alg8